VVAETHPSRQTANLPAHRAAFESRNHHENVFAHHRGGDPKLVCWNLIRAILE
jgi:hypothetical protein